MSNYYGRYGSKSKEQTSASAKKAAITRSAHIVTNDEIKRGADYLASLSPYERSKVLENQKQEFNMWCVFAGISLLLLPLSIIALLFG